MARQFSGRRLREHRTAAGLRPEQLAITTGRSFHSIVQYERGERTPSAGALVALADALNVTTDSLFEEGVAADVVAA